MIMINEVSQSMPHSTTADPNQNYNTFQFKAATPKDLEATSV